MHVVARLMLGLALVWRWRAATAQAQQYPSKPIRMIVSIAAGSVTDVIMRAAAAELQSRLGQPLVIENIGGAAGILGGKTCAQAPGDGYTICVIYHSTMSFNPLLFSNLPYNPDTDIVPVSRLFFLVEGLFASSAINVNTVAELKTLAQCKPDGLNYATLGEGSYPDLFLQMDEQPVGHQDRRHSVSRRRPGGAGAGGQRRAGDALRRRQLHRRDRGRQGEGAGGQLGQALAGAAERADLRRGRLGRLSGPGLVGPRARRRARRRRSSPSCRANSRSCSAIRSSSRSSTSRRWWRRRPRRRASRHSSSRTARTPRR